MATTSQSVTATPGRRHSFSAKTAASGRSGEFTNQSVTATPGRRHSFSAKTAADPGDGHAGLFTNQSVTATPGRRHSFTAKDPATPTGKTGLFTHQSVTATPGRRHSFTAKTVAPDATPTDTRGVRPSAGSADAAVVRLAPNVQLIQQKELELDENDMMEMIQLLILSGIIK